MYKYKTELALNFKTNEKTLKSKWLKPRLVQDIFLENYEIYLDSL